MGGFGQTQTNATPSGVPTPGSAGATGLTKEFQADRPQKMPVYNSPMLIESAKRKRNAILGRMGRASTNLTGNPGTQAYQSSFLGSVT